MGSPVKTPVKRSGSAAASPRKALGQERGREGGEKDKGDKGKGGVWESLWALDYSIESPARDD